MILWKPGAIYHTDGSTVSYPGFEDQVFYTTVCAGVRRPVMSITAPAGESTSCHSDLEGRGRRRRSPCRRIRGWSWCGTCCEPVTPGVWASWLLWQRSEPDQGPGE